MARVKSQDTAPEMRLRMALWAEGLRYRLHYDLPGKPDLVFVSPRIAIFVDGCFWHGCPLHGTQPKTNADFWSDKLKENMDRDERVNARLKEMDWNVVRLWEHEVENRLGESVERIIDLVRAH